MDLFRQPLRPINIGLESFYESLLAQGVDAMAVDWRPPLEGYVELTHTPDGADIEAANAEAFNRIVSGRPMLVGMGIAREVIPGFAPARGRMLITHSGPPITWERMCGPTRGAIMGALIYEGLAETPEEAAALAASGEIEFAPCHHFNAVGPMAGIISPSMPVFIVKNETTGHLAYATQNEGLGKVLRYGAYGPEVIRRLKWMEKALYPALKAALEVSGPIDLRSMIAQALHMGDEGHNRNRAGTSLFIRAIAPALVEAVPDPATVAAVLRFIDGNDHFFLNLTMPAMKAMLLPAEKIPGCTLVTVMARNGTDWGIRVSATGDRWFTAPAPLVEGLWLPGFTAQDANPDIGDSAITETGGIGGFALAGAPAIVKFVGGTPADALNTTLEMYEITQGEHPAFTIPALNFRGTPVGIDVRKVMRTGILPRLNTGIAHKDPGIGMVGAGLVTAPRGCFVAAFEALRGV
ncbi:MAG: DUF1116 domain-containing protein [Anaerolineae bacterium]|nr:DUF1116 domain-containing protein [Anaerolineae bacterium]